MNFVQEVQYLISILELISNDDEYYNNEIIYIINNDEYIFNLWITVTITIPIIN